jgi:voltage-gated potassium channel Kch
MVGAARGAPMRRLRQPEIEGAPAEDLSMANHVVVYGYRAAGYAVDLLRARGFQVVVVDEDRRLVRQLRQEGITAIVGSGSNEAVLRRLDLPRARLYIVAEPDPILSELAVRKAREIAPSLAVVAHAGGLEQRARLMNAGVREAVVAEEEVSLELARHALVRMGVSGQEVAAVIQRLRLRTQGTRLEE